MAPTMPLPKQNTRGIKRKRPNYKESEEDKGAKLSRKLHHGLRELRKVIKKARAFEVQRTLKRLKEARCRDPESDVTKDLEIQMEILKHLSYDQLAQLALMTKLKKDKTLSSNPTIQVVSKGLAPNFAPLGAPGTPTAKVQSRILSSKVLASEVISIVETLRVFLHPAVGFEDITPNTLKKRRTGTGHEKVAFSSKGHAVDPSGGGDDEYENASGNEVVEEADDGWESGTVEAPSGSDDSVAGAADDHDTRYNEDSSEADLASEDPENSLSRTHGFRDQSEFLPSLSVGFTRGDSDSGFSDSEAKLVDGVKKNRRGQRARRAIWEKKFGKNANHIKKQEKGTERRQPGSVPVDRRSGKGNTSARPRHTSIQPRAPVYAFPRPIPRTSQGAKNPASTAGQSERMRRKGDLRGKQGKPPLHPSWEAKRKHKSASIVPSQGTKIVFSES